MPQSKKIRVFMIAMVMILVLSACSTSSNETKVPDSSSAETGGASTAAADGEKVELRFLLWGNQQEIDRKTEWTEEFNARATPFMLTWKRSRKVSTRN